MDKASNSWGSAISYSMGEVFCGVGGLSRGFHNYSFQPLFANDIWPLAVHNFLMNFDTSYAESGGRAGSIIASPGSIENLRAEDLLVDIERQFGRPMSRGDLDVLLGGPPCQGFSVNSHIRSAADPRNYLFKQYIRLLQQLAPKIFVLENVPGMLSLDGGRFLIELIEELVSPSHAAAPSYEVSFKILNAAHYGVPQERFRLVVIGTRSDIAKRSGAVTFPEPVHYSRTRPHFKGGRTHTFYHAIGERELAGDGKGFHFGSSLRSPISVKEALDDLPKLENGAGSDLSRYDAPPVSEYQMAMRARSSHLYNHWSRRLMPKNAARSLHIPPGGDWRSIPAEMLPAGMQRALRKDHTTRYGRLAPQDMSGTLLTKPDPHWGTFLHYDFEQQRLISVREAARIQSFPDHHVFYGSQGDQYKPCGNAVPPKMASAIALQVKAVLDRHYGVNAEHRAQSSEVRR